MIEDVKRLVRHLIPVGVIYAVSQGWIPDEMQSHLIEAGAIASSIIFSLIWSRSRDKKAGRA
jgi:hypothetical protein